MSGWRTDAPPNRLRTGIGRPADKRASHVLPRLTLGAAREADLANYDEWGVIIPAPAQGYMGEPRYDDEHRGPAVTEAYALSRCWIDLAEHSRDWPSPASNPDQLIAIAERKPADQRDAWLKDAANRQEVDRLLSYAIRSGELPIWVAPTDELEKPVPAESILEMDHATLVSGTYRPPNDRGWLYGRPLFVKRKDWVRFVREVNRAKTPGTEANRLGVARAFTRDDPATIAPWWSVNQALAWIATRVPSYIEYIGGLETQEPLDYRPWAVQAICESQVAESDECKALMGSRRASWPAGSFLAHAGRALLEKILTGQVAPMTRDNGQGREMRREEFAGIGSKETGGDWLDLKPQPLFSSAEIMRAFPASEVEPGVGAGIVPQTTPNRNRKRPGPAPDPDWPDAIASVAEECISAGYKRPLKRGGKAAIQTMLLNYMSARNKNFSDDIARKHAESVIAALPDNYPDN